MAVCSSSTSIQDFVVYALSCFKREGLTLKDKQQEALKGATRLFGSLLVIASLSATFSAARSYLSTPLLPLRMAGGTP